MFVSSSQVLDFNKKAGLVPEPSSTQLDTAGEKKLLSEPSMFEGKLKGYQKKVREFRLRFKLEIC